MKDKSSHIELQRNKPRSFILISIIILVIANLSRTTYSDVFIYTYCSLCVTSIYMTSL